MLWSYGRSVSCTKLTTGFLAEVYIATLTPTDNGRRADDRSPALTRRLVGP